MSIDLEGQKRPADTNGYHAETTDGSSPFKKCRRGEGPRTEVRLLMHSKSSGAIIGKSGANIKRLRESFKAGVTIPDANGPERILTVTAELGTALEVLLDILPRSLEGPAGSQERDYSDSDVEARLLIHQSQAGGVIGRAGAKIKELREATGTNLKVFSQCCPMSTDRVVQINGKTEQVVDTIQRITESLAENGVKGQVQPYDPFNFNDFESNNYGGYGGSGGNYGMGRGGMGMGMGGPRGGMMEGGRPGFMGGPRGGMGGGMGPGMNRDSRFRSAGGVQGMADADAPLDPTFAGQPNTAHSVGEKTSQQVSIPKDLTGSIIGPQGTRIRAIRAQSGAQIIIGKAGEGGSSTEDRIITINGAEEQVQNAQYLLQMSVKQHSGKY
jgi:heterogeneous nuclear ribonucleoprotein K